MGILFGAFSLIPAGDLSLIAAGLVEIALGLLAMTFGALGVIVLTGFAGSLVALAAALYMVPLERLQAMAQLVSGLGNLSVRVKVWADLSNFTKQLANDAADLKPILSDLSYIAGKNTAATLNQNQASTNIQNFAANFQNIFQPQVVVEIGGEQFDARVLDIVNR